MVSTQWRITVHYQIVVVGCYNSPQNSHKLLQTSFMILMLEIRIIYWNLTATLSRFHSLILYDIHYQYSWRIQTNKVTIIPIQWKYFYLWRKNIVIDNILSIKKNCYVYTLLTVFYPKIICNQNKTITYWCTFIWANYILR